MPAYVNWITNLVILRVKGEYVLVEIKKFIFFKKQFCEGFQEINFHLIFLTVHVEYTWSQPDFSNSACRVYMEPAWKEISFSSTMVFPCRASVGVGRDIFSFSSIANRTQFFMRRLYQMYIPQVHYGEGTMVDTDILGKKMPFRGALALFPPRIFG